MSSFENTLLILLKERNGLLKKQNELLEKIHNDLININGGILRSKELRNSILFFKNRKKYR